jgi:transglutaminase-like putative cysteine protease
MSGLFYIFIGIDYTLNHMYKFLFNLLIFISFTTLTQAQNFPYGKFTVEEMHQKNYKNDTSAHAFVLEEFGSTRIDVGSDDAIKTSFKYHVRIKILDSKGFDKGTVKIPFYDSEDTHDEVTDIKAITTYMENDGSIKTAELDRSKIFTTTENKYWKQIKFAMPNLRNGCIIEYTYTKIIPGFWRFPSWEFQDDIPKAYSEYEVHIPAFWTFNAMIRGSLKLTKNKADIEKECFDSHGSKSDCSFLTYGMANIPAFIEEDNMTSPKNFLSAIYFNLESWTNPYTSVKKKETKEWKDIDYNLKHAEYFGSQIKKDLLKPYIAPVIAGKTTEMEKAIAVYTYIQKTIKWNEIYSPYSDGVRKALDKHTGHVADINLCLVAALNSAGVKTEAVLLSTRGNGLINRLYPVENEFNYVIAKANIGTEVYLLDATDPMLPFGMLLLKCLNDQGRVMSLDKPSYWVDLVANQKKASTSSLDLTLQPNGKLKGTITTYSIGYEAYEKRKAIKKFNTLDEFVENLDEKLGKITILKSNITNLDSLDKPLGEQYEVEIDLFDNLNHNRLAFNPVIINRYVTNPFKLEERNYPVDWGMPSSSRYMLVMHLPDGYGIESSPQGVAISLPNKGGKFMTEFKGEGNIFTYSNVIQLDKSIYAPEEYPYLKELYNKIIASEKAEIVFRKK